MTDVLPGILSLCSGMGALDMGLIAALDGRAEVVAHAEYDDAPALVLAHHFPHVPNYRDVWALADWVEAATDAQLEEARLLFVAWITAGYPCQPFSIAGKMLGVEDPRHLYPAISRIIARLRPDHVLLENVRNHLTIGWDIVVADLDRLGYDVRWVMIRASDAGAAHDRARLYALAVRRATVAFIPATWHPTAEVDPDAGPDERPWVEADAGLFGAHPWQESSPPCGRQVGGVIWAEPAYTAQVRANETRFKTPTAQLAVNGGSQHPDKRKAGGHGPTLADEVEHLLRALPTPMARDWKSAGPADMDRNSPALSAIVGLLLPTPMTQPSTGNGHARNLGREVKLLPTPVVNDMGADKTVEWWDDWTEGLREQHGNGNGHGMLPTPLASDGEHGGPNQRGGSGDLRLPSAVHQAWGDYEPAIRRWEAVTRPAPAPISMDHYQARRAAWLLKRRADALPAGRRGPIPTWIHARTGRLSAYFDEWLMGVPHGWVVDVPGVTYKAALKLCGNGVVPQQAEAAARHLLAMVAA